MTFEQIISDLKNKVYHPVYFLMGEESYFIDEISDYIAENVLDENEKEFNQTILYGKDADASRIIEEAKRFPMMSNHNVVIIKEAQHISSIEDLLPYILHPLRSTLLVICYKYKSIDKRKTFAKALKDHVLFESKKLYENKIPEWITNYLKEKKYSIHPKATVLLTEFLGAELSKIVNELNKLMLNVPEGKEITTLHIEQYIGISKDYNHYELNNVIGKKDILQTNRIVNHFANNSKDFPLAMTLAIFYNYFTKVILFHSLKDTSRNNVAAALKVNPFFVNDYIIAARNYNINKLIAVISYLKEYDLKYKGINNATTNEGELLKELVFKILH